jgi:hypothetical protein
MKTYDELHKQSIDTELISNCRKNHECQPERYRHVVALNDLHVGLQQRSDQKLNRK